MAVQDYLGILGFVVRDRVTNFEGVAVGICFDLFGCVQVDVRSRGADEKGELRKGYYFDHKRLEAISLEPVMAVPTFETPDVPQYSPGRERGGIDHSATERA